MRNYILNPIHPLGKHKARVFASALQIQQEDAALLQEKLLKAASTAEAVAGLLDDYGQRYTLDFELVHKGRRATVRSGWIYLAGETSHA